VVAFADRQSKDEDRTGSYKGFPEAVTEQALSRPIIKVPESLLIVSGNMPVQ